SADTHAAAGRIVDPAVPDWRPVKPQKAQIIALALVFGSLLGAVLAFLRERSIQTIDSVEAAESRFKCDVLASVPQLRRRDRQKSSRMISVAPHSIFSESIR